MAEEAKKEKETGKRGKRPFSVKLAFIVLAIMGALFLPITVVLGICMIPTLVAVMVDAYPEKTAWVTIGAPNLAGTMPVLMRLFEMGPSMQNALLLALDMQMLLTPLLGAAAGWMIQNYVTALVSRALVGKNERRLREIDKRQKDLIRKWGGDVAKG